MTRVTIVISDVMRPVTFEWIAQSAIGRDFDLSFILMNPGTSPFEENLRAMGCEVHFVPYRGKKDLPRAIAHLTRIFKKKKPDVVHTHLVDANIAGLTAARICGVKRRIHTRHHSNPHHLTQRHALIYDHWVNFLSTEIVVASDVVRDVLTQMESVSESKLRRVSFGIKLNEFDSVTPAQIQHQRQKHGASGKHPVIGMVSRYVEYKGLQYAIPAFGKFLKTHPDAYLVIANASESSYAPQVKELLKTLPASSYKEVVFEIEMPALYKAMDFFVHVPIDAVSESFGQAYTEALACKLPAIFTLSGIACEFIEDEKNALVVPFENSEAICAALERLSKDPKLSERIAAQGASDARRLFGLDEYIQKLYQLYA